MEVVAVLFVFFILIAFTMIFFASLQKSKTQTKISELHRKQSIETAQTVINLPELRASRMGIAGVNTFDTLKLEAFSRVINNDFDLKKGIYEEKLGFSTIEIIEIYPGNLSWTLYDNPLESYTSLFNFFIPVSLFNPLSLPSGNYSVGLLQVKYYS